jgi:hypothetical protein
MRDGSMKGKAPSLCIALSVVLSKDSNWILSRFLDVHSSFMSVPPAIYRCTPCLWPRFAFYLTPVRYTFPLPQFFLVVNNH